MVDLFPSKQLTTFITIPEQFILSAGTALSSPMILFAVAVYLGVVMLVVPLVEVNSLY